MEDIPEGKHFSFPKSEERTLDFWDEIDAFKEQLRRTEGQPEYTFYDGPPFATGLPHYGHILAGTLKDIVTRYASVTGHHVSRRFGWDCHGLPVEYEIDKKLGIKSRDDVLAMGIAAYNEECRAIVMRYSSEWERTVRRLGRWIDFKNDYKTLDRTYMESVWWVFKSLHDKGLVYRGFKVMPFSTACATPLSNFEAGLNYKDVQDPAVSVAFPLVGDGDGAALVAWTTTPWTLPSNLALCVHPELTYVRARDPATGKVYVVAEARLAALPGAVPQEKKKATPPAAAAGGKKGKAASAAPAAAAADGAAAAAADETKPAAAAADKPAGFEILSRFPGKDLDGLRYEPLFPYFAEHAADAENHPRAFSVCCDSYVTADSGTGVVHQAPAFGEDDYRVCLAHGVVAKGEGIPCPVDMNGRFTAAVSDFEGKHVKEADKEIVQAVKRLGRLVEVSTLTHSYPFCWRSDTPLIYRAVPSWFVAVEKIKDRLLACNAQTHWVPSYVKDKRFHAWLEGAHDWAVSRSRFWGTPIPVWASPDGEEIVVIGSAAELEQKIGGGIQIGDLHRHFVDDLEIPSSRGPGFPNLKRVEDVFDCWFESGSMPYGQLHYPFENKERFESGFPADFVAEGLDQTRGWFYTLMVLSTALFDKPAFRNLVCNGLVLAADGKKMSKRLKNYPDPTEVIDKYGADALRLYLINSPVVRAETLRFKEEGVFGVVKDVFLPWYNAYRFLVQAVLRYEAGIGHAGVGGEEEEEEEEEGGGGGGESGGASGAAAAAAGAAAAATGAGGRVRAFEPASVDLAAEATNVLDVWVAAAARGLVAFVREEMAAYRLYTVVPELVRFVERLTNVYVRFNRGRLKGGKGAADARVALATLHSVLLTLARAMAPFTPFLSEHMYRNLIRALPAGSMPESVHFAPFPEAGEEQAGDRRIRASVDRMTRVVDLGRVLRERRGAPLKRPLRRAVVVHPDPEFLDDVAGRLREYVLSELNVREVEACADPLRYCSLRAEPEWGALAARGLGRELPKVAAALKALGPEEVLALEQGGEGAEIEVAGVKLGKGDVRVIREFKAPGGPGGEAGAAASAAPSDGGGGGKKGGKKGGAAGAAAADAAPLGHLDAAGDGDVLVVLDFEPDPALLRAGAAREVVNRFMRLRKKAGLVPTDPVELFWRAGGGGGGGSGGADATKSSGGGLACLFAEGSDELAYMRAALVVPLRALPADGALPDGLVELARDEATLGGGDDAGAGGPSGGLTAVIAAPKGSGLAERLAAAAKVSEEAAAAAAAP